MELFIENQFVDVDQSFSTLITLSIDDIRDFGAKNTTFSKTIVLPGTKRNNALFGNIFEVTASNEYNPAVKNQGINFNAAVSAQAYIFSGNIQVFKGIVRVMEVIIDNGFIEYEVSVFGELGGFAAKMGNNKLENLDFSAYNHTYTTTNIVTSWDNASGGSGYYYPHIDCGNYSAGKHHWKYKTFRPALFAKEYIDKIFTAAGYSYTSALFNTTRFKSLIVPHNQKVINKSSSTFVEADRSTGTTQLLLTNASVAPVDILFPSVYVATNFTNTGDHRFTYTGTPTLTLEINFHLDFIYSITSGTFRVKLFKNGTEQVTERRDFTSGTSGGTVEVPDDYSLTLATGDYIEFKAEVVGVIGASDTFSFNGGFLNIASQTVALIEATYGDALVMNELIPQNILQKDFISSIVKLFNLYVFEDPDNDRVLNIMPFVDFFANASSEDWSSKLDRSKPIRVKPMSELNARYYEFKFKDDSDYYNDLYKKRYNQSYGSLIYDSQYEFAKETETVDLIFSGTPLVGYTGEDKIYSTIFKRSGDVTGTGEESVDSNIRLLQAKKIACSSWNILADDGTTNMGSQSFYGYAGHLDDPNAPANDIQFGVPKELFFILATGALNVNQFNVYWSSYMAEITDKDSRLLTGTFKLSFQDIYNLDFSKLIWIDGNLYRLNKIIDFNATNEDYCNCEMIKVLNKLY